MSAGFTPMVHTDSSRLVGLTSPQARVVLGIYILCNVVFMVTTAGDLKAAWPSVVALVLVNGAAIVLVQGHPDPFPARWTLVVSAAVILSTLLVAFQLPDHIHVGRASWHVGANTWLLFFLAIRRRPVSAWLTFSTMAAITVYWGMSTGRGWAYPLGLIDTHAAILLVATLFAVSLRRTARLINDYEDRMLGAAGRAASDATAEAVRRDRVTELRATAVPLLERLAAGGAPQTDAERAQYRAAEAQLRDTVRARHLVTDAVAEAAAKARERGVDVVLLDDRGRALAPGLRERVHDAAVAALDAAGSGSVTVRLHPDGRELAASIVVVADGQSRRTDFT